MDIVANVSSVTQLVQDLASLFTRVPQTYFERGDIAYDNRRTLERILPTYERVSDLLTNYSGSNAITNIELEGYRTLLQQNSDMINEWHRRIDQATPGKRVKRMKDIMHRCEVDINRILDFLKSIASAEDVPTPSDSEGSQTAEYQPENNVPEPKPRLTLDFDDPDTCEGMLKAAVLRKEGPKVIAAVALGRGGTGKTCTMQGLAYLREVQYRFPGGQLYIQLGNDKGQSDVVKEIERIMNRTGRLIKGMGLRNATFQDVCDEASLWFRQHTCLLLIDDIWCGNGIDIDTLQALQRMLNDQSRLVFTSRDRRFSNATSAVIEFSDLNPHDERAKRMLLTHADFKEDELDEANNQAVSSILDKSQGLPLALGIFGAAVREYATMMPREERNNAWTEFHNEIISNKSKYYMSSIVDASLQVLEKRRDGKDYQQLFRGLSILEKQQVVPVHVLQKLWDLTDVEEAEHIVEQFDNVSIAQRRRKHGQICVQLHDLVLEIAIHRASLEKERQEWFRTLVRNYTPQEDQSMTPTEAESTQKSSSEGGVRKKRIHLSVLKGLRGILSRRSDKLKVETDNKSKDPSRLSNWWNVEDDNFLYDNLCRVLIEAGNADDMLRLLSRPEWIVKRLTASGIYEVEKDLEQGTAVANMMKPNEMGLVKHLKVLIKAVRMSSVFIKDNPDEAWFQLYGHLVWYATHCNRTKQFIDKIEQCAPRPWAKASVGFIQPAGGSGAGIIQNPGSVLGLSGDDDHIGIFWRGTTDEAVGVTFYNTKNGTRKTERLMLEDEAEALSSTECASFAPDMTKVVTGHRNGKVRIWDETGKIKRVLDGHPSAVLCVAFNADGTRVLSGSADNNVLIWDADSGFRVGEPLTGHTGPVWSVAFSPKGRRVASASDDHTLRLWDGLTGEAVGKPLVGHTAAVLSVAFNQSGRRLVSGSFDHTVRVWNVVIGEQIGQPLVGHTHAVWYVGFSPDGRRISSGSQDQTLRMWDAASRKEVGRPLTGHSNLISCLCFSKDGKRLISGAYDHTVRLWDLSNEEMVQMPVAGSNKSVWCVASSADGTRVVSGSQDNLVRMWDKASGEAIGQPLAGHTQPVRCVAFSPDGKRIISGSEDRTLRLWDTESGQTIGEPLAGHKSTVWCVAFSPDGSRVASGSVDNSVRIWDVETGKAVGEPLEGHADRVSCVLFSAEGNRVVSASQDCTVRVWDAQDGSKVTGALYHSEFVSRIGVDSNGSRVASIEWYSGFGRLWRVDRELCEMISEDVEWKSTVALPEFTWSDTLSYDSRVTEPSGDDSGDSEIVLATCKGGVERFGDRWCSRTSGFSEFCDVIR